MAIKKTIKGLLGENFKSVEFIGKKDPTEDLKKLFLIGAAATSLNNQNNTRRYN